MTDEIAASALRKVRWRLIPFLFLLYIVAYLDRVNVGFAAIELPDLGSRPRSCTGSEYFPSILLEYLAPDCARFVRSSGSLPMCLGLLSSDVFVDSPSSSTSFASFSCREAGFYPRVILPPFVPERSEPARSRAVTRRLPGIGSPIRALFVPAGNGTAWMAWMFRSKPAAILLRRGLSHDEYRPCEMATAPTRWRTLNAAERPTPVMPSSPSSRPLQPRLLIFLPYFCIVIGLWGHFFLPQILQSVSGFGSGTVVLLSAIPYVAATVGLVVVGGRSDRVRERRWHVAVPCLIGAAGFVLTVVGPATPAYALTTLSIAAFGIWGTLGLRTCHQFPARNGGLRRHCAVNSVATSGGFVGPFLMAGSATPPAVCRRTPGPGRRAGHRRGDRTSRFNCDRRK